MLGSVSRTGRRPVLGHNRLVVNQIDLVKVRWRNPLVSWSTNSFSLVRLRSVLSVVNQFELSISDFLKTRLLLWLNRVGKKWVGAEVVVVMVVVVEVAVVEVAVVWWRWCGGGGGGYFN